MILATPSTTPAIEEWEWPTGLNTVSRHTCAAVGSKRFALPVTDEAGHIVGSGKLEGFDGTWKQYQTVIRMNGTAQHGRLNLIIDETGHLDLDMVSLFPVGHVAASTERASKGPGAASERYASRIPALPRRLHCGRPRTDDAAIDGRALSAT